jgi:hypothetical protein
MVDNRHDKMGSVERGRKKARRVEEGIQLKR